MAPEQPQAIADAILDMKREPERLATMGRNGREQLEAHFSRQSCVDLFEKVLIEAIDS